MKGFDLLKAALTPSDLDPTNVSSHSNALQDKWVVMDAAKVADLQNGGCKLEILNCGVLKAQSWEAVRNR